MKETVFDVRRAAEYLGCSAANVAYHVYRAKDLTPDLRGKMLVFTKTTLDDFKSRRKPAHRPRKTRPV